jgi:hypothetical protein
MEEGYNRTPAELKKHEAEWRAYADTDRYAQILLNCISKYSEQLDAILRFQGGDVYDLNIRMTHLIPQLIEKNYSAIRKLEHLNEMLEGVQHIAKSKSDAAFHQEWMSSARGASGSSGGRRSRSKGRKTRRSRR